MKVAILIFCLVVAISNKFCEAWSYRGEHGPDHWAEEPIPGASNCLGNHQSPINIDTSKTQYHRFPPFTMRGYNVFDKRTTRPVSIENNAHTVQVNLHGDYYLSGGGLPSTYKAVQFHLHWGSNDTIGSEHTLNNVYHPAEMHIVHYDSIKYNFIQEAITQPDGLAVLGFWIKIGKRKAEWSPFIRHLRQVKYAHHPYVFKKPYVLSSLLPTSNFTRFYRYNGSLTTPGCYESVIWTVFQDEIEISRKQLKFLRELVTVDEPQGASGGHGAPGPNHEGQGPSGHGSGPQHLEQQGEPEHLQDNFRPIQDLWDRQVWQSWPTDGSIDAEANKIYGPNSNYGIDNSRTDIDNLRKENNDVRIENNNLRITNNNLLIQNNNLRSANERLARALRNCHQNTQSKSHPSFMANQFHPWGVQT